MADLEQIQKLAELAGVAGMVDDKAAEQAQAMLGLFELLDDGSPRWKAMTEVLRTIAAKNVPPADQLN